MLSELGVVKMAFKKQGTDKTIYGRKCYEYIGCG